VRNGFAPIGEKKDGIMAEKSNEALRRQGMDHSEGAGRNGTGPGEAQDLAGRFDPFHDPYLADPYPFFARARAAAPVFYSPDLDYWVVTRYHDVRHIFQAPRLLRGQCAGAAPADLSLREPCLGGRATPRLLRPGALTAPASLDAVKAVP
jgi:hypothetical protein